MSYAPNYDVPDNVSPFVPLPMLTRCTGCRTPPAPFETWAVVRDGRRVSGLCESCAKADPPPAARTGKRIADMMCDMA